MQTIPRLIVTGENSGKSIIARDTIANSVFEHFAGLIISDIWATNTMPVNIKNDLVIENTAFPNTPVNGTYFRYVQIPPDSELGIKEEIGKPHPLMHKTDTLDYIVILEGEIYLVMDEEETLIKAGDIIIQRGTNHAWSNRSNKRCLQLAILIDAGER